MNNNNISSYIKGIADGAAQRTKEEPRHITNITEVTLYIKKDRKAIERQRRRETRLFCFAGWAFLAGLCWGITPYLLHIASIARKSNAPGGEIIIPLLPLFFFLLYIVENKNTKK